MLTSISGSHMPEYSQSIRRIFTVRQEQEIVAHAVDVGQDLRPVQTVEAVEQCEHVRLLLPDNLQRAFSRNRGTALHKN